MGSRHSRTIRQQKQLIAKVKDAIVSLADWIPQAEVYQDLVRIIEGDHTTDDRFKAILLPIVKDYLEEYYAGKSEAIQRAKATAAATTEEGIPQGLQR